MAFDEMLDITVALPQINLMAETVPNVWRAMQKSLQLMFHAFFWDGTNEVIGVDKSVLELPLDEMKLAVADAVRTYCQNRQPAAIVTIGEATIRHLPKGMEVDRKRMETDPTYPFFLRSIAIPEEYVTFSIESLYGLKAYQWKVIGTGSEATLAPVEIVNTPRDMVKGGTFGNLLTERPEDEDSEDANKGE